MPRKTSRKRTRRLDKSSKDFIRKLSAKKSHLDAISKLREYFNAENTITASACSQKLLKLIRKGEGRRLSYYCSTNQGKRIMLLHELAQHIIQQRDKPRNRRKMWLMPDGTILNSREVRAIAEKEFPELVKQLKTPQNFDRALEQIKNSNDGLIDSVNNNITDFIKVLERVTGVKITNALPLHKSSRIPKPESLRAAIFREEAGAITADIAWGVYMLTDKETGKIYIGITRRTFDERFAWHVIESKTKGNTEGGLAERLREIIDNNKDPGTVFSIKVLQQHSVMSNDNAKALEKECIKKYPECMYPNGYNLKEGGSLGGLANGLPFSMSVGNDKWYFDSFSQMIIWFQINYPQLENTYAQAINRFNSGYSMYEVLNIDKFYSRQGDRPDGFICNGKEYNHIRKAAAENGIPPDVLKSRLHRSINSGEPYRDLMEEKKSESSPKSYKIPHPDSSIDGHVSLTEFAKISGLKKSTVTTRYRSLRQKGLLEEMSGAELIECLSAPASDRSKDLRVVLPTDDVLEGGQNQITNDVCASQYDSMRLPQYGVSKARRELSNLLSRNPAPKNEEMLVALGFTNKFIG